MREQAILRRNQVTGGLYRDLLTSIVCGEYPPDKPMPTENSLASDYGVSRTIVREALARLKSDGYIKSVQGSGTVVVAPPVEAEQSEINNHPVDDLIECYECRLAIEPEIAAQVAQRADAKAVRYLKRHLFEMERELEDMKFHAPADAEFHIRLAGFSGNRMFQAIMESLHPHILFPMNIAKTLPREEIMALARNSIEQHHEICQAILQGDADKARQKMRDHIMSGKAKIFKHH